MAITTGLLLSSIFKSSGSKPGPRDLPEVILPNSLMSAPATKVRPPPIRTVAFMVSSCAIWSSASEIPSGTPGLRALTGGLLIVITAMPLSFVSCTKLVMEGLSFLDLRAFRGDGAGIDHQRSDPLAVKCSVAERCFRCFRPAIVQVKIVLPREAHAAVNLDATVADGAAGVAGIHFRDGNCDCRVRGIFFERPSSVVHR